MLHSRPLSSDCPWNPECGAQSIGPRTLSTKSTTVLCRTTSLSSAKKPSTIGQTPKRCPSPSSINYDTLLLCTILSRGGRHSINNNCNQMESQWNAHKFQNGLIPIVHLPLPLPRSLCIDTIVQHVYYRQIQMPKTPKRIHKYLA